MYEKAVWLGSNIWTASRHIWDTEIHINQVTEGGLNINPSYGSWGGLVYQTWNPDYWAIALPDDFQPLLSLPFNATSPNLFSPLILAARDIMSEFIFFEGDLYENNLEIFACNVFADSVYNVSSSPGYDVNPISTYLPTDTLALFWEHEVETGSEIWMARDTLNLPVAVRPSQATIPASLQMEKVFPNPFNASIQIRYTLQVSGSIQIQITDLRGRLVYELMQERDAGQHAMIWDASDAQGRLLPSGLYIVRIQSQDAAISQKLMLLR